jgi:hypothetical protein
MSTEQKENIGTAPNFTSPLIGPAALTDLHSLLDLDGCRSWLFGFLHPGKDATCCPGCGAELSERRALSYARFQKVACLACGLQFRATTGTPLHHCQLSPAEIILTAALTDAGATPSSVAIALGRGRDTAKIWQERLAGLQQNALLTDKKAERNS